MMRIDEPDRVRFSEASAVALNDFGASWACLLFTRLVTEHLFATLTTLNLHPAMLPSFKGLRALEEFREAGCGFLGTSAHQVTEDLDAGPLLAQTSAVVPRDVTAEQIKRISFAQKVYVLLVLFEIDDHDELKTRLEDARAGGGIPGPCNAVAIPSLRDTPIAESFWDWVEQEGIRWAKP